jgi:hypothetical protein
MYWHILAARLAFVVVFEVSFRNWFVHHFWTGTVCTSDKSHG